MTGNGNGMGLYRRLKASHIDYPLNNQQKFLPLSVVNDAITENSVKAELPWKLRSLTNRHVPSKIVAEAKKVFVILLEIGEPNTIKDLLSEGLTDAHLPLFPKENNETVLVSSAGTTFHAFARCMSEQRIGDFVDKQWIVLAPVLDSTGQHIDLDPRCPLPFCNMDEVGATLSSTVYKSELHPGHQKDLHIYSTKLLFAAKEFRSEPAFRQEKENLDTIKSLNHEHLIGHLATYKKEANYYVIFPWADGGSLRDFWEREDTSPRTAELALWSLQQMLGIAGALEALHHVNCRHGDLKPENILHFSEGAKGGKGKLVVADVGVSRSHNKDTEFRHVGTTTRATTPSYEAPETLMNRDSPRARRYDIWSLGCILLEFTLWFLHDNGAIYSLSLARNAPNFEFYLFRDKHELPRIHPIVARAIEELRQDVRCKGTTALGALINLIWEHLLQVDVNQRDSANEVVERLRKIVQDAEATPPYLMNIVATEDLPPKLRFPRRTQTGAFEPSNSTIAE